MKADKSTIQRLKQLPPLFRAQDAEKIAPHTGVFLYRAAQDGLILRLARGTYVNAFLYGMPSVEAVACFLRPPAYISCEWALNYHGVLLQSPDVCSVVTLHTAVGQGRSIGYQGVTMEFSRIAPRLFHGYTTINGVSMATPEKALLDTAYLHQHIPAADELEMEHIDMRQLERLSDRYPATLRLRIKGLFEFPVRQSVRRDTDNNSSP
ncbi:MAG TPA: hypothetical protein PLB81_06785 [Deltaproteobacteria bacterium]|nr:hypothetical protein [Deltaproteobacteria bacterium]